MVTIVFSDLKGATAMGERLDSESLQEVMARYFDAMRAELEGHGGVIEKFIGDAIMAVFGLPKLHEDGALRAVRAAAALQRAQEVLNDELKRHWGVRLTVRTGVNTGEVVAGDLTGGQRLVTGDAVNVAARLEQAAGAQEILLGDLTYRLVRDYVDVEAVEPLELKGKAERVPAYRFVKARGRGTPAQARRAHDRTRRRARRAPFGARRCAPSACVPARHGRRGGGHREDALDRRVPAEGGGRGVDHSGAVPSVRRGITYWPLAEAVRSLAGVGERDSAEAARVLAREGSPGASSSSWWTRRCASRRAGARWLASAPATGSARSRS